VTSYVLFYNEKELGVLLKSMDKYPYSTFVLLGL
jgi:hypothetical protein